MSCVPAIGCPSKALEQAGTSSFSPARCVPACPAFAKLTPPTPSFVDPTSASPNLCLTSDQCPHGFYGNTDSLQCEPCMMQGCARCLPPGNNEAAAALSTCFECMPGYFLDVSGINNCFCTAYFGLVHCWPSRWPHYFFDNNTTTYIHTGGGIRMCGMRPWMCQVQQCDTVL